MSKEFVPFVLTPFQAPPSLADSLKRASSGNCEHPTPLKEPKNPKIDGAITTNISIPGQGRSGGSNLTLAFNDFDKRLKEYENDRMRWLENQLSPSREGAATRAGTGGVTLEMESANANLTITPTGPQDQTAPLKWTFTVNTATFVPRWG